MDFGPASSTPATAATALASDLAEMVVLALDIGGTQIRAAAILPDGTRLGRCAAPTPLAEGAEAIYRVCAGLLRGVADDLPAEVRRRVAAIGISSMGPVDPWRGLVLDPPNVRALHDAPLADEMEARLGLPAFLDRFTSAPTRVFVNGDGVDFLMNEDPLELDAERAARHVNVDVGRVGGHLEGIGAVLGWVG